MIERRKYAEGSRRVGELSVTETAKRLELHPVTVRRHAVETIEYAEAVIEAKRDGVALCLPPPRLSAARRDSCGRLWIPADATFRAYAPTEAAA